MKFKISQNSLFAILARSQWWFSVLIAGAIFVGVRQFLPDHFAVFSALPFLAIACYAGWKQIRAPSATGVASALAELRTLSWQEFAARIEAAFRRDGHTVAALSGGAADYEVRKNGRAALVGCKRWKVAQTGIGPLRELIEAKEEAGAHECIYVTAGDFTEKARQFASQKGIRLLSEAELAQFIARGSGWKRK